MLDRRIQSLTTALVVFMVAAVALCVVALLSACRPVEPEHPPTYNATSCAEACAKARDLCGPATLTPKTGTCEQACAATESGGGDFRTGCLSAAATCDAVAVCSR